MKHAFIAVVALVVVALGVGLVFGGSDSTDTDNSVSVTENSEVVNNDEQPGEPAQQTATGYQEYNQAAFEAASDKNRVVFFHADWCPTCRFYKSELEKVSIPGDIVFFEASFDDEDALKDKYGVNVQSTFVLVDANDEVIKIWPFGGNLDDGNAVISAIQSEV